MILFDITMPDESGLETLNNLAKEVFLNVISVSTYRHQILGKMDMKNNLELIKCVLEHNLLTS